MNQRMFRRPNLPVFTTHGLSEGILSVLSSSQLFSIVLGYYTPNYRTLSILFSSFRSFHDLVSIQSQFRPDRSFSKELYVVHIFQIDPVFILRCLISSCCHDKMPVLVIQRNRYRPVIDQKNISGGDILCQSVHVLVSADGTAPQ